MAPMPQRDDVLWACGSASSPCSGKWRLTRRAAGHTGDAQVLPTLTKVRAGIPLQWIMQLILYRRCVVCDVIVAQCPRML